MTTTEDTAAVSEPVDGWNRADCTTWCNDAQHVCDPACWGSEVADQHEVLLSLEEGFPRASVQPYDEVWLREYHDPARVGVYAYREQPGYREVIYFHLYRPHDNEHLNIDTSV